VGILSNDFIAIIYPEAEINLITTGICSGQRFPAIEGN